MAINFLNGCNLDRTAEYIHFRRYCPVQSGRAARAPAFRLIPNRACTPSRPAELIGRDRVKARRIPQRDSVQIQHPFEMHPADDGAAKLIGQMSGVDRRLGGYVKLCGGDAVLVARGPVLVWLLVLSGDEDNDA
jgi:hypothetical protein